MKRASGILMHVSSLYGDYSSGAFGKSAREFIDFLSDSGFTYWQVLPFLMPDECNSPYKSFGAFSGNPYFIDLEDLFFKGLLTKSELNSAKQISPYLCEYERLKKERVPLLKKAAERFLETDDFNNFFRDFPEVSTFCEFMALKEKNGGKTWTEWSVSEPDENTLKAYKFIEYEFFTQYFDLKKYASEKGIKIIGDMPIYVDFDSSDVRSRPCDFLLDENNVPTSVAGVPPDYFSKDGQLWGNPLYDYAAMKKDDFKWWKRRIAFTAKLFDGVRIDHFRAFESFYSVKYGEKTAKNGKWIKAPGKDVIKAIKSASGNSLIIAEDLGIITEKVEKLVKESGFPNMRVLQFAFSGDKNSPHLPYNYPENCVAYTGTHDNNTLLGYMWELDEKTRLEVLDYFGCDKTLDDCYDKIINGMLSSHAGLTVFPIQDLLHFGSDTRLNTPGRTDGNWAFRITKEQLNSLDRNKLKRYNELFGRI